MAWCAASESTRRLPARTRCEVSPPYGCCPAHTAHGAGSLTGSRPHVFACGVTGCDGTECGRRRRRSVTVTHVVTRTATVTHVVTRTATVTHVVTRTATVTHVVTRTATVTHVVTRTATVSHVVTRTATVTHVVTRTANVTNMVTRTGTVTHVVTRTATVCSWVEAAGGWQTQTECPRLPKDVDSFR
jgi:hypothetical protein